MDTTTIIPKDYEPFTNELKQDIAKGLQYLEISCRPLAGFQNDSVGNSRDNLKQQFYPEDIFISLMGLDLLGSNLSEKCQQILRRFVKPEEGETGILNFNKYNQILPDDVEDTSLYHYIFMRDGLLQNNKQIVDIARVIYLNTQKDGVIQLYYAPHDGDRFGRLDAGSISNAMRFLYSIGFGDYAEKSENYLLEWLISDNYLKGTRYYHSPDVFLFFCSQAIMHNEKAKEKFMQPLVRAIRNRVELNEKIIYPLDLACRILSLSNLNKLDCSYFRNSVYDMGVKLDKMQNKFSGAWPADALYKLGASEIYLGGTVVSTIFATKAMMVFSKVCSAEN